MELTEKKLYEYQIVSDNILFVDGVSRTGKAMLNNLLLGFDNISSIQFINAMEQLMPMYIHGKLDKNAFSAFLRLYFNENFYNYQLSRNINFRYDDLTSVHRTKNPTDFYKNLAKQDGDAIIDELISEKTLFQFQTHDLLTHYSSFLELGIHAQVIELFRHPVDTIHSWYSRGWGKRFDNVDPRSATTLFQYEGHVIPHYVIGYEEKYINLNEMEKCVFMHNLLVRKSIREYNKLSESEKKKILILRYEDLLVHPENEIEKMSNFLKIEKTPHMIKSMLDARVPRILDASKRSLKAKEIQSLVKDEIMNDLLELANDYEKKFII